MNKFDRNTNNGYSKEYTTQEFLNNTYVKRDVVYWKSNDRVPPTDFLKDWVEYKLIPQSVMDKSLVVQDRQTIKAISDYTNNREINGYSEEEKFEMRAAYGKDTVIVDAITGQRVFL